MPWLCGERGVTEECNSKLSFKYRCIWLYMCVHVCMCTEIFGSNVHDGFSKRMGFFQEPSLYKSHTVVMFCFFNEKKNNVFVITQ